MWLGQQTVPSLERCTIFRVCFIEKFHCIPKGGGRDVWIVMMVWCVCCMVHVLRVTGVLLLSLSVLAYHLSKRLFLPVGGERGEPCNQVPQL